MIGFTVATVSYAAQARVAMASLRIASPGIRRLVVFLDDAERRMADTPDYEALSIDDLGLDAEAWTTKRLIYDPFELSCAVKADVATALLARHDEAVLYVDSDVYVYGDIAPALERSCAFDLTVAPHRLVPALAGPGHNPEAIYFNYGPVNAGMFMVSRRSLPFLAWWQAQNAFDCRNDRADGAFVDQLSLALAPVYWSVDISRDPSMNVGFWNLAERRLAFDGDRPLVDGRPVTYVHFSGFDPAEPQVVSRHADADQRSVADADPVMATLLARYAAELAAADHDRQRTAPYAWRATADGASLTPDLRRALRTAIIDRRRAGAVDAMPDPFATGLQPLATWLKTGTAPAPPTAAAPAGLRLNSLVHR